MFMEKKYVEKVREITARQANISKLEPYKTRIG